MMDTETSFAAFISYATKNKERAEEICASLEAKGFRCWMAPRDIRAGYEYADEIVRGIDRSRCMVVVLSEAANDSPFVRREVERGVSKQKPIFPVRIEEVLPAPGLELFISATHWIDAWGSRFTEQVDRLAKDLSGFSTQTKPSWKVRLRAYRHRAARWGATAVAVAAAAAIIVLGGKALLDQDRDAGGTGAPRGLGGRYPPGGGPPAPSGPSSQTIGAPTNSSDSANTNATASAGAVINALREPYKQRALNDAQWMQCSEGLCSLPRMRNWFAGVKRVSFGESRDRLERTIDIVIPPATSSEAALREIASQYVVDYIPVKPGGDSIFARLDFYDGTSSAIQPARIQPEDGRTLGLNLVAIESPANVTAPLLFAGFTLSHDSVRFTPDAPPGTAAVMYSFDDGGFLPAAILGASTRPNKGFRFEGLPTGKTIRLELRMQNGDVIGPFKYATGDAATLVLATMKASLLSDLHALVKCARAGFDFNATSLASARTSQDQEARRKASQITSALERQEVSFLSKGPAIGCRPDWQAHGRMTRGYLGDWSAVEEIKFGTRPGRLGDDVKNTLAMSAALANKYPRGREFAKLWNIVLPHDAEGVYVQLVFRDKTTSPEFRVPIEELKLQ